MSTTIVHNNTTTDWQTATETAGSRLLETVDFDAVEHRQAVVLAWLRIHGWAGPPALHVAGAMLDGWDAQDSALASGRMDRVEDPAGQLLDAAYDRREAADALKALRKVLDEHRDDAYGLPTGTMLSGPPRPRRSPWLVRDWLVADRVQLVGGARGASKTTLEVALIAASIKGEQFMGQDVPALRWFFISGEQTAAELEDLFAQQEISTDDLRDRAYVVGREARVSLGEDRWNAWLAREVDAFKPDVLVIDSVSMVCTGVDAMNYDSVRSLFHAVLHPLRDRHGLTVWLAHHLRKGGGGNVEDIFGSSMWANEADFAMNVVAHGRRVKNDDGTLTQRCSATRTKTSRVVADEAPTFYEIVGTLREDGTTDTLTVRLPVAAPTPVEQIVAALAQPLGTGALAESVGMHRTGDKFRNALAEAVESGQIAKNDDNLYERVTA